MFRLDEDEDSEDHNRIFRESRPDRSFSNTSSPAFHVFHKVLASGNDFPANPPSSASANGNSGVGFVATETMKRIGDGQGPLAESHFLHEPFVAAALCFLKIIVGWL
jgi:hypothetical protein